MAREPYLKARTNHRFRLERRTYVTATNDQQALQPGTQLPDMDDDVATASWAVATSRKLPGLPYNLTTAKVVLLNTGRNGPHRHLYFELVHDAGAGFADCRLTMVNGQWSRALVTLRQGKLVNYHYGGSAWAVYFDLAATPPVFTRVFCPGDRVCLRPDHGDEALGLRLGEHDFRITGVREMPAGNAAGAGDAERSGEAERAQEGGHPQMVTIALAETGELVGSPEGGQEEFSGAWFVFVPHEEHLPPLWRFAGASEATPTGASTRRFVANRRWPVGRRHWGAMAGWAVARVMGGLPPRLNRRNYFENTLFT